MGVGRGRRIGHTTAGRASTLHRVQRRVRAGETLGGDAMAGQQSGGPDRRNDAFWLRLTIGGMLLCLLIYGCWQAAAWFAASFPTDFR